MSPRRSMTCRRKVMAIAGGSLRFAKQATRELALAVVVLIPLAASSQFTLASPEKMPAGIYNLRDFGANGNGSDDDATAILAALKAMPTTGGLLVVPQGNYLHASTIVVSKPIRIVCAGAHADAPSTPTSAIF